MVSFTVFGKPEPAGSKKAVTIRGRAQVIDDNSKAGPWKRKVRAHAEVAMHGRTILTGPLFLRACFYLTRPKGHVGARGVLASAPARPIVRPDTLKLARAVEDALTGVVYTDDALIVLEHLEKAYVAETSAMDEDLPRVEVEVMPLEEFDPSR